MIDPILTEVLARAHAEVGAHEEPPGSNDGPRVRRYLAAVGLPGDYPWCAAFVAWAGTRALGAAWPLPRTGDCDVLLAFARKRGLLRERPEPGDVFLELSSRNLRDARHTGFVTRVQGRRIFTIEGNLRDAVREEIRLASPTLIFVRWIIFFR